MMIAESIDKPRTAVSFPRQMISVGILVLFGLMTLYFVLSHLDDYPNISDWDEAFYIQTAHNLIHYGEYGTLNGTVFEHLVPVSGTGPGLIVPVALALGLSNDSLFAARLVIVLYLCIGLLAACIIARRSGGIFAAIACIPLFLVAGHTIYDSLWIGRQVLAEMPALAFLFVGLLLWVKGWQGRTAWLVGAAILLGCSIATKNQFVWIVLPGFGLLWLADLFYYRQLSWRVYLVAFAGALGGYVAWSLVSYLIVGSDQWPSYSHDQQYASEVIFLHPSLSRAYENVKFFFGSGQWFLVIPAIAYGLYRSRDRTLVGLERALFPIFSLAGLLSFVALDLPWPRYLYPPLILSAICVAVMFSDAAQWFGRFLKRHQWLPLTILLVLLAVFTGPRLVANADRINTTTNQAVQDFARQLDQTVPQGDIIYNWEWSVELYSKHSFIHPAYALQVALMDRMYNHINAPIDPYLHIPANVNYVVVGPFAEASQMYADFFKQDSLTLVFSKGAYSLYRLHH